MSSEPARLSAFVITYNEAERLPRTLAALSFADEIVVVDSGSTDDTVSIAQCYGAHVVERPFEGYGPQKAFAEGLCSYAWRLNVDADEVVSADLAAEIRALMASLPPPGAYRLRINTVYPGDSAPRPFAADYNVVRLYHRDAGRYRAHPLHDRVMLTPGVVPGQCAAPVEHHPFTSWGALVDKLNAYTSFNAQQTTPRSRITLVLRLPFEMPLAFFKSYVLRRHALGGWKGFAFATVQAFFRMLRLVKMLAAADARTVRSSETAGTSALTDKARQP